MIKAGFKYFSIICMLAINFSYAQKNNVESLHIKFKIQKNDTNKVNQLNKLAFELKKSRNDTAIFLSTQALMLSQELKWEKGEAKSERILGLAYTNKFNYEKGLLHFNKSLAICNFRINSNDIQSREFKTLKGKVLGEMASIYIARGNYTKALELYKQSLFYFNEVGDKNSYCRTIFDRARIYCEIGDFAKAMEGYLQSLKIIEELKDKQLAGKAYGNLGVIYNKLGDTLKAREYFFRSLKIAERYEDKIQIINANFQIGSLYADKKSYLLALGYFTKCLNIANGIGNYGDFDYIYSRMADVYLGERNYIKAEENYLKSLRLSQIRSNLLSEGCAYSELGFMYILSKRYDRAEINLNQALTIAKKIGAPELEAEVEGRYATLYEKTNRTTKVLQHYKKFIQLRDSLFSQESATKISRMSVNYEYEKQKEIDDLKNKSELEKQKLVADADSKRQNTIIWAVAFVLF